MRKVVLSCTAGLLGVALLTSVAFADNPAGAPANNVGRQVAEEARTIEGFGGIVASLAPIDDLALSELGLTPPRR